MCSDGWSGRDKDFQTGGQGMDAGADGPTFDDRQREWEEKRDAWMRDRGFPNYECGVWWHYSDAILFGHHPRLVEMHDDDGSIVHVMGGACICVLILDRECDGREETREYYYRLDNGEIWLVVYSSGDVDTAEVEWIACEAARVNGVLSAYGGRAIEWDQGFDASRLAQAREDDPDIDLEAVRRLMVRVTVVKDDSDIA
jgi:hypothetical protein